MSVRMSKYVCDECHVPLSTKYALERHKNTSRCEKNQRDNTKERINSSVKTEKDYVPQSATGTHLLCHALRPRPLRDTEIEYVLKKTPVKTIFASTYNNEFTQVRKRCHSAKFLGRFIITTANTEGHMLHNVKLHIMDTISENVIITVHYNNALVFSMPLAALNFIGILNDNIPLWEMIFGSSFLPIGKLEIAILSPDHSHSQCQITYDSYILLPDEAKQRLNIPFEKYFNAWFSTNIVDNNEASLLTGPLNCYVADIYYTDTDAVNPSFSSYKNEPQQEYFHYSCLPNLPDVNSSIRWNIDNLLFASLIGPGEPMFLKNTEDPVVFRYISLLRSENGKACAYHHPYNENPMKVAQRRIAERIMAHKEGLVVPHDRIGPWESPYHDVKNICLMEKNQNSQLWSSYEITVPVHWMDLPSHCNYTCYEPDWELMNRYRDNKCLIPMAYLAKLTSLCEREYKDLFKILLPSWGPSPNVMTIDGSEKTLEQYYCFKHKDKNQWYGFSNLDIEMYIKYHVPMNKELETLLTESLNTLMSDQENAGAN